MNRTAKGNRRQLAARKKLEAEGWLVYAAHRGWKGQPIDIWGLFDLIAYKGGYIRLIQVKSNRCPKETRVRIEEFLTDGGYVWKEIWIYKDHSRHNPWIEKISC